MATHLGARAETQQPRAKSVKKDLTAVEPDPNDTKVFPLYSWNQRLPGTKRFELVFNGSGVLDRETGLVWQRYIGGSHDGLNWQGALQYCWQAQSGKRMGCVFLPRRSSPAFWRLVGGPVENLGYQPATRSSPTRDKTFGVAVVFGRAADS